MINFPNMLPATTISLWTLLIATALAMLSVSNVVIAATTRLKGPWIRALIALGFDVFVYQAIFDSCTAATMDRDPVGLFGRAISRLNPAAEISLAILLLAFVILRMISLLRMQRSTITYPSVGEALDDLPTGVIFAAENGQILQTNRVMEKLNLEVLPTALRDGNAFWETIVDGELNEGVVRESGEHPIIHTPSGETWIFSRELCESPVANFYQIHATNATEEQNIKEEIDSNVLQLKQLNRRLHDYNHIVDEAIRNEELLDAKKRVHDNMGTSLLSVKVLATSEESPVTRAQILEQWYDDLELMREEAKSEEKADPFERFRQVATYLGIELQIMGEMPADFGAADLIATGIQECMTNAIQHAEASQMYVTIAEDAGEYTATYSNNGKKREGPVREGGGLTLLRTQAEKIDATIEYPEGQRFCMVLHIPKMR